MGVSPRAGTGSLPPPAGVRSRQEVCWALSRRGDRPQPWPVSEHAYRLSEGDGELGCKQASQGPRAQPGPLSHLLGGHGDSVPSS